MFTKFFSNVIQLTAFSNLIPQTYISWCLVLLKLVHAPCILCKECTGPIECIDPMLCMFLESGNKCNNLKHFFKKNGEQV